MRYAPLGVVARYVLLGAALGVPAGVVWAFVAPRVQMTSIADGTFTEAFPQQFIASDLILGSLLLVTGSVIGVGACVRLRRTDFQRGWSHVVGAICAGLTAAAAARVVGWWLAGRTPVPDPSGSFGLPLQVQASGVMLLGCFSALLVVVLYSAFASEPAKPSDEPVVPS